MIPLAVLILIESQTSLKTCWNWRYIQSVCQTGHQLHLKLLNTQEDVEAVYNYMAFEILV